MVEADIRQTPYHNTMRYLASQLVLPRTEFGVPSDTSEKAAQNRS